MDYTPHQIKQLNTNPKSNPMNYIKTIETDRGTMTITHNFTRSSKFHRAILHDGVCYFPDQIKLIEFEKGIKLNVGDRVGIKGCFVAEGWTDTFYRSPDFISQIVAYYNYSFNAQYYILNHSGTQWVKTLFDASKRQINLYNDDYSFKGIGQY